MCNVQGEILRGDDDGGLRDLLLCDESTLVLCFPKRLARPFGKSPVTHITPIVILLL